MGYAVYAILRDAGHLSELRTCLGLSLGELTALAAAEKSLVDSFAPHDIRLRKELLREKVEMMQVTGRQEEAAQLQKEIISVPHGIQAMIFGWSPFTYLPGEAESDVPWSCHLGA